MNQISKNSPIKCYWRQATSHQKPWWLQIPSR